MSPERWRQIEELYHAALEFAPGMRTAFLGGACGPDADLRHAVEALLAQGEQAGSFLETPALEVKAAWTCGQDLLGAQCGVYRIVAQLGAGGMGDVYRAHDSKLGRDVAIKTLPPEFASDPVRVARFEREARVLASLNHPNIAAIYGREESGGSDWLVLELVEGQTLKERIDGTGRFPLLETLNICRQVAEALEAAHKQGIVHRDLKPANIKVTPDGRVKVLDFGLAKAVWGEAEVRDLSQVTGTAGLESIAGQILGTPPYMSPEQTRGKDVDKRTDIWAFGCLLYQLLTGNQPFRGETLTDTIAAILEKEPDWQTLPAATPLEIRELLRGCLQKDAAHRLPDMADVRRRIEEALTAPRRRRLRRWKVAAVSAVALAIVALAAAVWTRGPARPAGRSAWVPLTTLPDSASQPALSPDGRMLAFVRGPETFAADGQIFIKRLPGGEAIQLTHDESQKMSPAFSPDGTRIAYTVTDGRRWDTWVVPVTGGQPRPWLSNASGLVWFDHHQVLFSEIKNNDIHMGIVAAGENRAGARDLYVPPHDRAMGHRSYASPDGKWVLVVEMDRGWWLPCRLLPMDGSSAGRPVGPPDAACTFAAWSRDGKWMYLSSSAGGTFHIWRQRLAGGPPEQITAGPTEEEGIAMAPDGRSFVTAVALRQSSVWIHDSTGERQISLEGYSFDPQFSPDGKKLCYRISKGASAPSDPSELWVANLDSGRSERLLPGILVAGRAGLAYDISPDSREVLVAARDNSGKNRLWIATLDRQSPPRRITDMEGDQPKFGIGGTILFRHIEGASAFAYRVREDGTGLGKALERPIVSPRGLTPDHEWLMVRVADPGAATSVLAIPVRGGAPLTLTDARGSVGDGDAVLTWSRNRKVLFISTQTHSQIGIGGSTYAVPLPPGRIFPRIPPGGFRSEAEIARLPGARRFDAYDATPGPTADVYAFSRQTVQRNLYRIPLQ
jgi:Tol biopolymer transport system component